MTIATNRAAAAALVTLVFAFPAGSATNQTTTDTLWVEGMTLPDCDEIGLELLLGSLPGVIAAEVVFSSGETTVRYDPAAVDRKTIVAEVVNRGFRVAWIADVFVVTGWAVPERDALAVRLLVGSLEGVDRVEIETDSGRTIVRYDPARVSGEDLTAEIRNLGYQVTRTPGSGAGIGR